MKTRRTSEKSTSGDTSTQKPIAMAIAGPEFSRIAADRVETRTPSEYLWC